MALRCLLRTAHDPGGNRSGYRCAYPVHRPGGEGGGTRVQSGTMHPPKNRLDAEKTRQDASDQIGVVHPALNHIRPIGREYAPKRCEPLEAQPPLRHRQTSQGYPGLTKQRPIFSLARKRDDEMRMAALGRAETKQGRLGAAILKSRDDVQDLNAVAPSPRRSSGPHPSRANRRRLSFRRRNPAPGV